MTGRRWWRAAARCIFMANQRFARVGRWATSRGSRRRTTAVKTAEEIGERWQFRKLLVHLSFELLELHHVFDPRVEEFERRLLILARIVEPAHHRGRIHPRQDQPLAIEIEFGRG